MFEFELCPKMGCGHYKGDNGKMVWKCIIKLGFFFAKQQIKIISSKGGGGWCYKSGLQNV